MHILVIGAGLAGLTAARTLAGQGHRVTVLERNEEPGGRLAALHAVNEDADQPALTALAFDHGAQYFTVRDARFDAEVHAWHEARVARVWHGTLASFDSEGREAVDDGVTRWVGAPHMDAIGTYLADGLDITYNTRVVSLTRANAHDGPPQWHAATRTGHGYGPFDAVIVATPAPQAVPLLAACPALATAAGNVRMHPCWAVLVAFETRVQTRFDGAFVSASPLAWIARDRSKPRRGFAETWVLHASPTWSAAHMDDGADAVGPFLLNAFADLVRAGLPRPAWLTAHRWRHACASPPLNTGVLADDEQHIVLAGDWLHGNRVEGAFLSGLAAAERVMALLA